MKNNKKRMKISLSFNVIMSIIIIIISIGFILSLAGYAVFSLYARAEYTDQAVKVADTANLLVNGNMIDAYLVCEEDKTKDTTNDGISDYEEYERTRQFLQMFCDTIDVSIIYVIKVDTTDYLNFTSIFNIINSSNTIYTPWPIGYQRATTNEQYEEAYRNLYENGSDHEIIYREHTKGNNVPHLTAMAPIKDSTGNVTAIMCVQSPMENLTVMILGYLVLIASMTIIICFLVSLIVSIIVKRRYINPITKIKKEAVRFATENSAPDKHLDDSISNIEEISALATSIDTMESEILNYVDSTKKIAAEKEKAKTELKIASIIQEGSIPSKFPAFPERKEFDIYASMDPAKEVGGDFYDYFFIDDDHLALVIADVSGKGVPAALFMMISKIIITVNAMNGKDLTEIISNVNNSICAKNPAEMFVTVWFSIYEISTGKLKYVNAGHEYPMICRNGGNFEIVKTKVNFVVGGVPNLKYKSGEIEFKQGDKLFLYTDGLPEACNADGVMYKADRALESLNKLKDKSCKEIIEGMKSDVDAFVNGAQQFDDLTMMCFNINEVPYSITIDATDENYDKAFAFISEFLDQHDCAMKPRMEIELSVEEIYVNVAHYAYGDKVGKVMISLKEKDDMVYITFTDSGIEYNPLEKPDPDITLSASERQIGGLGIYLVKKKMDDVIYEYRNKCNILTLVKKIK